MATIFSKIVSGEIPSYKIAETEHCFAFLDINPLKEGHTLVIPKREVDDFFDLTDDEINELMLFSKTIAKAIKKSFECRKVSISVIGLEVPHAHVHLIPINTMDDCNFMKPKIKIEDARMQQIQEMIKRNLTF